MPEYLLNSDYYRARQFSDAADRQYTARTSKRSCAGFTTRSARARYSTWAFLHDFPTADLIRRAINGDGHKGFSSSAWARGTDTGMARVSRSCGIHAARYTWRIADVRALATDWAPYCSVLVVVFVISWTWFSGARTVATPAAIGIPLGAPPLGGDIARVPLLVRCLKLLEPLRFLCGEVSLLADVAAQVEELGRTPPTGNELPVPLTRRRGRGPERPPQPAEVDDGGCAASHLWYAFQPTTTLLPRGGVSRSCSSLPTR